MTGSLESFSEGVLVELEVGSNRVTCAKGVWDGTDDGTAYLGEALTMELVENQDLDGLV